MKNTMKKILCTFLVVVMCLTSAPLQGFVGLEWPSLPEINFGEIKLPEIDFGEWFSSKASAATEGYYTYTVTNGKVTITDVDASIRGDVVIPSTLGGYSVTTIGDGAFYSCDSLTSITIPDSVTTIGYHAFSWCDSLTSITIGDSVTTIGEGAFAYCRRLTSITIPDSVTTIGEGAFANCYSLASITIPNSVTTIGDRAFYDCDSLTSVTIGDSVTTIGDCAFYDCYRLTSVTIPDSVTTIGDDAFDYCKSLTSITIGDSVTTIGDHAFADCYNLTSITIPDSVTTIGDYAFDYCKSLTSITIGDSVTTIGAYAFCICDSLTSIVVDADNPAYSSDSRGALFDKNKTILIQYPIGNTNSSYSIPNSVTTIGDGAFNSCDSLSSITIPDSVTTIGDGAFAHCDSLTSIVVDADNPAYSNDSRGALFDKNKTILIQYPIGNTNSSYSIPNSVTTIGDRAFYSCGSLTSVTIPDSVTTIGAYAFAFCYSLTSITIPNSVTTIGDWAFYSCDSLTDVYYNGTEEQWKKITIGSLNDCLTSATIHYNSSGAEVPDTILDHEGIKYDYDYSDSYFASSSFNYNHDLAIASYCLAISAMVKGGTGEDGKYGTEELDAARTLFRATEFDNCQPYGYDKKPEFDSIACVIGHKNVVLNGQEETVIAIGIRGSGYESEWSGNFRLGNSTEHAGFAIARDKVMQYLEQYINNFGHSFNNNLKFWVTGYSRAAATANLVAATLNNDGTLNGVKFDFVNDIKERYSSGDVYAYTFETPLNTTSKEASDVKYSNIYNFINRIDYVPKVAPSAWGYTRYGENLYMPSLETEGARYYKYLDEMKKEYKKITGKTYTEKFDFYEVGLFMEGHDLIPDDISLTKVNGYISQSEFLDELIDIVANDVIISADNYVKNYESSVRKLMPVIMDGSLDLKITLEDIIDELSLLELVTGKAENLIARVLMKKIAEAIAVSGLSYDEAYDCLGIVDELVSVSANNLDYVYTLLENAANIKPAHEPSVNFAWLVSIEPDLYDALEDGDWYLKFVYNCPIDIALYDENGELLATIVDDKVVFPDDRYLTVYVDSDGQKCFCLPNDTEYRFEILGTDDGTMTCSVSKYDFTENKNAEILNYYDIPVENGTELTMTVNEAIEEELTEKVQMTDSDEKILNYDDHLESEEIESFNVSVTTNTENGYVSGGGTYHKGEYAKVEAAEIGCNKFVGWYIDNTCISTEIEYRLPVTESVVIEARFLEKHTMGEWYEILPATCETTGVEQRDCSECDYSETQEIPATGHDFDGSKCKNCDYDKADTCGCNCHKGGIAGFFFKLILFFQKIFRTNKTCSCGVAHY